jgi:RNA polymerase sigma-70 factor (ECF subfamily)
VNFLTNNKYQQVSDRDLVLSYKKDYATETLGALYQRYMDLVYGVCLKYLKEREISRDAVLNIYEELVVKLKKHEVDNFKSWLYTLAKNHCLMYLRSPKNRKTREFVPDVMHFEENVHLNGELEDEANFSKLERCLKGLVKEQEQSVQLFYYEQKCYKDIADITGYDPQMVRSYIQNGRRNLKICMEKN